jgi:molecular chaperone GrpE
MTDDIQETTQTGDAAVDSEFFEESGIGAIAADEAADLKAQLAETNEALLRARADFANYKRRVEDERIAQREILMEKFLKDFLPIADNLERALSAAAQTKDYDRLVGGVEAVHRQMQVILDRSGVRTMDALYKSFDPNVHNAIGSEPSADYPEGTVIEELQKGYLLGSRVLRPAMVKVAA